MHTIIPMRTLATGTCTFSMAQAAPPSGAGYGVTREASKGSTITLSAQTLMRPPRDRSL